MSQALLGPWPGAYSQPRADQTSADSVAFTEGSPQPWGETILHALIKAYL